MVYCWQQYAAMKVLSFLIYKQNVFSDFYRPGIKGVIVLPAN